MKSAHPRKGRKRDSMPKATKMFTAAIDSDFEMVLNQLREGLLGTSSKADVFRQAIAVLRVAQEGTRQGWKLALVDRSGLFRAEIPLLWKNNLSPEEEGRNNGRRTSG